MRNICLISSEINIYSTNCPVRDSCVPIAYARGIEVAIPTSVSVFFFFVCLFCFVLLIFFFFFFFSLYKTYPCTKKGESAKNFC